MFWCLGETPTPFSLTPETTSLPLLPSHSVVTTNASPLPSGAARSSMYEMRGSYSQIVGHSFLAIRGLSPRRLRSVRFWIHIRGSFPSGEALPSLEWDGQRHMFTYYPIRSTGHRQLLEKVSQRRVPKLRNGSDSGCSPLRVIIRRCPVSVTSIRDLQSRGVLLFSFLIS